MNQLTMSFTDTRARRTDGQTSRDAARHAATGKAAEDRLSILRALQLHNKVTGSAGLTAKELVGYTGLDYFTVQRRISEVAGIEKTAERRDGCFVWKAV
jgi:hypothetical protein